MHPGVNLLTFKPTLEILARSRTSLESDIADGLFPVGTKFGRNLVWARCEVEAIAAARLSGMSDDDVRALVVDLIKARPGRAAAARAAAIGQSISASTSS